MLSSVEEEASEFLHSFTYRFFFQSLLMVDVCSAVTVIYAIM